MVLVDGIHPKIIQELPKIHPQIQKNMKKKLKTSKNHPKITPESSQNHPKIIARSPPRGITTPLNYLLTYLLIFTFIFLFIYLFSCTVVQLLVFWIEEQPQKRNISLRAIHAPLPLCAPSTPPSTPPQQAARPSSDALHEGRCRSWSSFSKLPIIFWAPWSQ